MITVQDVEGTWMNLDDSVQLEVKVKAGKVIVKAGAFRVGGTEYHLEEDQEFSPTPSKPDKRANFHGYLVKSREGGDVALLVEECIADGSSVCFDFSDPECPLELLNYFLTAEIRPNAAQVIFQRRLVTPSSRE
jgi:hypothetical protein